MLIKSRKTGIYTIMLCICLMLNACSNAPKKTTDQIAKDCIHLKQHVIKMDNDGLVLSPIGAVDYCISQTNEEPVTKQQYDEQFVFMLEKAEEHAIKKAKKTVNCPQNPIGHETTDASEGDTKVDVKLLLHVHGGLNFFSDTEYRVDKFAEAIESDCKDWHFPIFISWPSSPLGTYGEHLTNIRSGNKVDSLVDIATTPFVFMTDVMQIGNIVSSMYSQVTRVFTEIAHNTKLNDKVEPIVWQQAKLNYEIISALQQPTGTTDNHSKIYWSTYHYPDFGSIAHLKDYIGRHILKSLTFPVRTSLGTLLNSAIVESAWRNMKRRTKNIFYPPLLFNADHANKHSEEHVEGGLFFKHLLDYVGREDKKQKYNYEITLVGHSMGTMVLNHAFKKYRKQWLNSDTLKNIIYMAAAASIKDTMDSVFPIVSQKAGSTNHAVSFYNLTLNRLTEISETTAGSLLPNGSLLINIDDHLEHPEMPLDRTMGQEVNVLAVLPAINKQLGDSAKHVHFKSFDRYHKYGPDKHGSFNQMPFWREEFWSVDTQTIPPWHDSDKLFNGYPKDWFEKESNKTFKDDTSHSHGSN